MSEIEEVRKLIALATFPGIVNLLKHHERLLQEQADEAVETTKEVVGVSATGEAVVKEVVVPLKQNVSIAAPPASGDRVIYTPITNFAWDQDGYDSPTVTVYIDLEGVGSVKDSVKSSFTKSSFDVEVRGLAGQNYRLVKDNLDKDIEPERCRVVVKKNKILVKLSKVRGQHSYESW